LDILLHNLQFFFVPKVLVEIPAHADSFIVISALLVLAQARQSDSRISRSTLRLAEGCFVPTSLRRAGGLLARLSCAGAGPARHA
jgi:hypothetical protein